MEWGERWARLFADLEAALDAEDRRLRDSEIADRTRRERAAVTLGARFLGNRGVEVELRLVGPATVAGHIVDVGGDWVAVAPSPFRAALIPLAAIDSVIGLGIRSEQGGVARRFGFGYALREISRDRLPVRVLDRSGLTLEGTVDGVGADFLDLSEHPRDEARRPGNVRGRRTIPFGSIACLQTGQSG